MICSNGVEYFSVSEACRQLDLDPSTVVKILKVHVKVLEATRSNIRRTNKWINNYLTQSLKMDIT